MNRKTNTILLAALDGLTARLRALDAMVEEIREISGMDHLVTGAQLGMGASTAVYDLRAPVFPQYDQTMKIPTISDLRDAGKRALRDAMLAQIIQAAKREVATSAQNRKQKAARS